MAYIVRYGENLLSDYCSVLNVKRSILPNRSNFSKQIPVMNGSYFTGGKYSERIITLDIAIYSNAREDYAKKIEDLANILNQSEPQQLIIDDEPYKCYYAILDGSTDLTKVFQNGTATLTFICHEPTAESLYWNTYQPDSSGIFSVSSYGTTDTYPIIDVDFNKEGSFFQLTNYEGKTVLIGAPKNSTKPTVSATNVVVNDKCQDSSLFTSLSQSLLDENRLVTGQYGVGYNGDGIICTNYGSGQDGKWTGAAFRKSIGQNVGDFEVTVDLVFSSKGENYVPEPPKPQPEPPKPPAAPSNPTTPPATNSLGTYKVVNCGGLYINKTPDVSQPLYAMAPGTYVYPTEIKNGWAKHTHSNQWNTFTGWSSMKYLQKVSDKGKTKTIQEKSYADEQMGIIEIYGYNQNGGKLFKLMITDWNEFYEFTEPRVYIGDSLVLSEGKNTPTPRKVDDKNAVSGVFGDYNDFVGNIVIKRESNNKGQKLWSAEIKKIKDGKVVKSMSTSNSLSNASYPNGDLNYIGVFIGKRNSSEPVTSMAVTNIKVEKLNMKTDESTENNVYIFKPGDHLQIDFKNALVTLNHKTILSKLDIGSEFFTIPSGNSQFLYKTDANNSKVLCGFKDRFI